MTIQYLLYKMVKSTPSGGQNECRTPAIINVVVQVVLNSLIFTGLVLPDWSSGGDWLADAFERAANGESVETSVNTANGKADVVLEIVGGDTISLAITSAGSNNYALEIAGVTPTPVSTRPSGVMKLVPKSVDIPKEAFTPVVIATQNPTSAGGVNGGDIIYHEGGSTA